jgi:GNAT superfamily N-acetyltransferase
VGGGSSTLVADAPAVLWTPAQAVRDDCGTVLVRGRSDSDKPVVADFLRHRHAEVVARLGRLERPLEHPALLVGTREKLAGALTYVIAGDSCEILTLHVAEPRHGVGTALMRAVEQLAREHGCRRRGC